MFERDEVKRPSKIIVWSAASTQVDVKVCVYVFISHSIVNILILKI